MAMMNRGTSIVLLSISAALLATLVIVLATAPEPVTKTIAPNGAQHHVSRG
ncbi:hypothetical protein [Burkholderia territorii]|uniref:hypothetical protein n=1 Tax=Burkholderia territorii TaxID=1503055 RepID=UPI0012DAE366|nr:hypothetical protein [Burkholderia territorii]